jgi:hypothetical protein
MAGGGDVLCALLVVGPALLKGEGWRNATRLPLCLPPSLRRLSTKPRRKQTRVLNGAQGFPVVESGESSSGEVGVTAEVLPLEPMEKFMAEILERDEHAQKAARLVQAILEAGSLRPTRSS